MDDQTAGGKVLWHFTMSLDGFVTGPDHDMSWMSGITPRPGFEHQYTTTTGAILGGRAGWDAFPNPTGLYGGAWTGPVFVLTHHPEDATPTAGVTFLDCDLPTALTIAREAAGDKNVEVLSADIGRQLLALGLLDEIDLHIAPVLLGDGTRLYDNPGGTPIRLHNATTPGADPFTEIDVRYRPVREN